MKQEEIDEVEGMLEHSEGYMGYACLYSKDGGERKEFVFEMTPDHIANFHGVHQEAKGIPLISRETYDVYGRWEDGMVTAPEISMP